MADCAAVTGSALLLSPSNVSSCGYAAAACKPVAMVQPRKVHGVRVLPSPTTSRLSESSTKPSRLARSPAIRAPRPPPPRGHQQVPAASRWAGGRLADLGDDEPTPPRPRHRYGRCARHAAQQHDGFVDDEDPGAADNWQCNAPSSGGGGSAWPAASQLSAVAEGPSTAAGGGVDTGGWTVVADDGDGREALLMTKKKDAEIAALLRHIRLTGLSRDVHHGPRRTAFNECLIERINFERSLGYYP